MVRSSVAMRMSAFFVSTMPPAPSSAEESSASAAGTAIRSAEPSSPARRRRVMKSPNVRNTRAILRVFPLLPPWEIGGHILGDDLREVGRPLLEEGDDALLHVGRGAARVYAAGVDLVSLHWVIHAQATPHHLADQRDADRGGVVDD